MEKWSNNESNNLFKSFHTNSSVSRLGEFHKKLIACTKLSSSTVIPNYKVFRNQVKSNYSPKSVNKPKFDYYSDISSFRTFSPKSQNSPAWKYRVRTSSITLNLSGKSSPKSLRTNKLMEILRFDDLKKVVETVRGMNEEEFSSLPSSYLQFLSEFSEIVRKKL